jgi:hypothetical protein
MFGRWRLTLAKSPRDAANRMADARDALLLSSCAHIRHFHQSSMLPNSEAFQLYHASSHHVAAGQGEAG